MASPKTDPGLLWPTIWLGEHKGRIAGVSCDFCHWHYELPHLGQSLPIVLTDLRNAWGIHCMTAHDGYGFRHFDEALENANE